MSKLWGGRFQGGLDPFFEKFNRSLPFDRRLVDQDIVGSIAWAKALGRAGVLTPDEVETLAGALRQLREDLARDSSSIAGAPDEDVHSFVERQLLGLVGVLARKLHTGRSRNDQVATDLKLWLRAAITEFDGHLDALDAALLDLADRTADLPMPGYTHLQRAQPITAGHHAMAYREMLARDRSRLRDADARMATCPLGSGALAGTAFPIDRQALAEDLDFHAGPTHNSLDAVSDRDHVAEVVFACTMVMIHLSRLAEDWIFLGSSEAGMVRFSDAVATGSSLMPQKKNPDALELIRGKCGRVAGQLQALLMTMKALPLAYDKDLQEDKEALFDALDTTMACVRVATTVVATIEYVPERCRSAAATGQLNATDLADLLVRAKVPFRDAHERVGQLVRSAIEHGCEIEDLPADLLATRLPELKGDLRGQLRVEAVLARRDVFGGTAPERVRAAVLRARAHREAEAK